MQGIYHYNESIHFKLKVMVEPIFTGDEKDYNYGISNLGTKQKVVLMEPSESYNPFVWDTEYIIVKVEKRSVKEFFSSLWYLLTHRIIIKEEIC